MKKLLFILAACSLTSVSPAAVLQLDLLGTAGPGLLFGNEPGVASGGTGNEFGSGITFDDVSKVISINVHWGSANGYLNMTGNSTNAHLHATAAPFGFNGTSNFMQTGGVVVNLQTDPLNFTTNTSASSGSIVGSVVLSPANEALLIQRRLYLNVHSGANPGGEMRGFLVPEPATAFFGLTALGALALRRNRGAGLR